MLSRLPVFLLLASVVAPLATAQDDSVTERQMRVTVQALADSMRRLYVFEEEGEKIADLLEEKLDDGAYESLKDRGRLAAALTRDLQSVNGDRHLRVRAMPPAPSAAPRQEPALDPAKLRERPGVSRDTGSAGKG